MCMKTKSRSALGRHRQRRRRARRRYGAAQLGPWTPAVHALLRHLEGVGFPYSSRVLGFDAKGREVLELHRWRHGQHALARGAVHGRRRRRRRARWCAAYHDAVASFMPPPGSVWRNTDRPLAPGEIVRHGDLGTWNMIWRDGELVGLIDWDFAEPGLAIVDAAYAAKHVVPLRETRRSGDRLDGATRPQAPPAPVLRGVRRRHAAQVLDAVDAYNELSMTRMQDRGARRRAAVGALPQGLHGRPARQDIAWLAEHKASLC